MILDRFSNKMGGTISDTAANAIPSSTMMSGALNKEFGQDISAQLMTLLQGQGFITGQEINYQNCNSIDGLSLNGHNKAAHSICDQIAAALANDYQSKKDSFAQYLVSLLTGHMVAINKNDLIKPLANEFAGDIIEKAVKELKKKQEEAEAEAKAGKKKDRAERKPPDGEAIKNDLKAEAEAKEKAKQKTKESRKNKQSANCPGDGPGVCNIPNSEPKTCSTDGTCGGTNAQQGKEPYGPPLPRELLPESDKKILDAYEAGQKAIEQEAQHIERTGFDKAQAKFMKETGKLASKAVEAYKDFAKKYPWLAEHGADIIRGVLYTIVGGPAGAAAFAASLGVGIGINAVAGDKIAKAIEKGIEAGVAELREKYPELSEKEAKDMAIVGLYFAANAKNDGILAKMVIKKAMTPDIHFHADVKSEYPFNKEDIGINKNKFQAEGDYGNPKVVKLYEEISHHIPEGRVDYSGGFLKSLENFEQGTSKLHHGPLKEDLYLVNYHDYDKEIGLGKEHRTMKWATHTEVANKMPTMEDIHQHLALVEPDWGKRDGVTLIKIPKGTDATFVSGKAGVQYSDTGKRFEGGGFQVRFRDFDEKWIIETRKIK